MLRRGLLTVALVVISTAWPSLADACTCVGPNPPCQAVWSTPDVFVGQVLGIDASPADKQPFLSRRVRIRATEVFRGRSAGEVDVWTGQGGGDCGYDFKAGESYLIYAYRDTDTGRMSTGICSRTQPLSSAGADLEYLRSIAKSTARFGRIIGSAMRIDLPPAGQTEGQRREPFAGARIIAEGGGRTYEARTASDGTYEIAVPPGTYAVRVDVPDGFYALSAPRVTVQDARGCATNVIGVYPDGRIAGRLVGANREPVALFALELIPVLSAGSEYFYPEESGKVRTDDRGLYEFSHLRAGTYYIGYGTQRTRGAEPAGPRVLLAGSDGALRTLQVTPGGRVNVEDLAMPSGAKLIRVVGKVTEPNGAPAAGARVHVNAAGPEFTLIGPAVITDGDGRFTATLIADRSYRLIGEGYDDAGRFVSRAEGPVFTATSDITGVTLTLRPNR